MMMKYMVYLFVLINVLILTGCGDQSKTVANVNGMGITQSDFDAYLKVKRLSVQNDKQKKKILNKYLDRLALAGAIEQQGVLDSEAIAAELTEFKNELLISRYFDKFLKDKVSEQAVLNYYNSNPEQFQDRRVNPAHILIRTNKKMDEAERQAKWTLAQEVYSKARAGEDFGELARNYSQDKISGKKGGDLGWLQPGAIGKVFSDKIFSMKKGDITEPFETPFGFHVVKILEGEKLIKKPFGAVKGDIRYQLRVKAKSAELERLKKDVAIEIK